MVGNTGVEDTDIISLLLFTYTFHRAIVLLYPDPHNLPFYHHLTILYLDSLLAIHPIGMCISWVKEPHKV
ncbi:uncharacterized protein BT62DRAFT_179176 [Guyanagaster necrorhizus]|uniref:Uncharacterized protein n=1 Tax=Guyanagaster necrorhizus TaxID=856835 RepID=A0A9P8ARV6_9AGAR|nr:uncharacterized protein BT62DRAFT_179176 [Guyanagaster necrorhizus MCA 3950]KAG7445773.1 hypothetical protein BT62DRAFT_179176 [Guyanagaster necrorhizus MCA 3950]